ncbi:MAG: response regulator [Myxococcaceae bacterium]
MAKNDPVHALIVDDDRAIQRLLADALTKHGFVVTVERDGEWALKTFEKKPFDVVLLDLLLPALNGYEVARKMRGTPKGKRTPIIMISGVYKNALHQKEAVTKHGAYAFLEKPIRLGTLYEALQSALGNKYPRMPEEETPEATDPGLDKKERYADDAAQDEATQVEAASRSVATFQSIKGDFAQKRFPEVLAEVYRWKGTGALLLRREKVKKIVYFKDGLPVSIKSNLLQECLGRVMVRERMISDQECEESLQRMKKSGRQQGTVLVEMGCISPHNLNYALQMQLQTKLFDVFTWDNGEYQFNPRVMPPPDTVGLEMSTAQCIYEGVKRAYDDKRVAAALGDVGTLYAHPSENPLFALQDLSLAEEEQQLLQAVDGHKKIATLRALALLPPTETDKFLYAMKSAQLIELKPTAAEGKPKPSISRIVAEAAQKAATAAEVSKPPPLPPLPKGSSGPRVVAAPPVLPWDAPPGAMDIKPPPKTSGPKIAGGKGKTGARPAMPFSAPLEPRSNPREPVIARAAASLLPELSGVHGTLNGEESLIRERLVGKVAAMRKQDFFEVLGVSTSASREEIKRAYFALAKEYHPDKHFGRSSAEIRQLASQVYDLISTAHDTLTDPNERERYVKELASGVKRDMGDEVGKILAAEGKFQKGEELLRHRDFKAAHDAFQEAVNLYGEEGEFHAWLGWTQFQMQPENAGVIDAALRSLEKAITLNPKSDRAYLFTGYIFKATGRPDKAEKQFEKAIQCNPDCTEALRELRILGRARK